MDCGTCDAALDDLVDGVLAPVMVDAIEAHCRACAPCASALADLRALRAATLALPRSEPPPPELWAAVAARTVDLRPRTIAWLRVAAAASLTATVAAVAVLQLATPRGVAPLVEVVSRSPLGASVGTAVYAVAEPGMERRAHFVSDMTRSGKRMPPATLVSVQRSMRVIHQALLEVESAVEANPNDANLRQLLTEIHIRESALIARMQRLSIENNQRNDI